MKKIWVLIVSLVLAVSARATVFDPNQVQVYLVPLSDFPETLSVQLAKALSDDLDFWVKSSLQLGELGIEPMPGTNQLPSEEIIAKSQKVIRSFPETSEQTYFLILTVKDINSQSLGFRFQFSTHIREHNTSVLSLARLLDFESGKAVLNEAALLRLFKMAKRAIGEMKLGWARSSDPRDVMYSPLMSIRDLDRIGVDHVENESDEGPEPKSSEEAGAI